MNLHDFLIKGGVTSSKDSSSGILSQDRYSIGPKLIMLRLYIALMRGNMEKCRQIAKNHCNFVHVSSKPSNDPPKDHFIADTSVHLPSMSNRKENLVAAGGNGKI